VTEPSAISAEPLAVWDCRERDSLFWQHWQETHIWAMEHLKDANSTYRAEFHLIDIPFAVVHRFATDDNGRKFRDSGTGCIACATPVIEIEVLDELPPAHLLRKP
jgi:hypothetical protein